MIHIEIGKRSVEKSNSSSTLTMDLVRAFKINWLLTMISIVLFTPSGFSFSRFERQHIYEIYADRNYDKMKLEYEVLWNHIQAQQVNPCLIFHSAGLFPELNFTNMESIVVMKDVSVSLDDSTFFNIPAFIRCSSKIDQNVLPDNFLMIINVKTNLRDDRYRFAYWRIIKVGVRNSKKTFTVPEILSIQDLIKTYGIEENRAQMGQWYRYHQGQTITKTHCNGLASQYQFTVQNEEIEVNNLKLLLDDHRFVLIPGVLECKVTKRNRKFDILYFVRGSSNNWYQVYKSHKQAKFAFERYLIGGNEASNIMARIYNLTAY